MHPVEILIIGLFVAIFIDEFFSWFRWLVWRSRKTLEE